MFRYMYGKTYPHTPTHTPELVSDRPYCAPGSANAEDIIANKTDPCPRRTGSEEVQDQRVRTLHPFTYKLIGSKGAWVGGEPCWESVIWDTLKGRRQGQDGPAL